MTTSTNVFSDPQATMAILLRPPENFESLYQGLARSTPLPFVMANSEGRYLSRDFRASSPEMSSLLLRYVPVTIGATMLLAIPRARFLIAGEPAEGAYTFELRWRMRALGDHNASQENAIPYPYSLPGVRGATEDDGANRIFIPTWTSERFVPSTNEADIGSGLLPVVAAGPQVGYAAQGVFKPNTVGGETIGHAPNTYYAPLQRRVLGNELSVVCYRAGGGSTWDFPGEDGGISNVYGTNLSGVSHPVFQGVGMLLFMLTGSPAL